MLENLIKSLMITVFVYDFNIFSSKNSEILDFMMKSITLRFKIVATESIAYLDVSKVDQNHTKNTI